MNPIRSQHGATLIVGLIILLVMTVIGVTGMKMTSMEEKMTGNARDRDLAFQAADSALRAGENCVEGQPAPPNLIDPSTFTCNAAVVGGGFYPASGTAPIWETLSETGHWNVPAEAVQFAGQLAHIDAQPSYVVEQVGIDYGSEAGTSAPPVRTFRITARAIGGTPDATAIVQSTVKRY